MTHTLKAVFLVSLLLILPQCSDKSRDDYIREGLLMMENQDYMGAEEAFVKATEAAPQKPDGYYYLGGIYNAQKRYTEAVEHFKKALRLDPTYHDAYFSLGYAYEELGMKKEAEQQYATYKRLKKRVDHFTQKRQEAR